MPSLHEIEKAMYTLWMDEHAREWLDEGAPASSRPASVKAIDPSILAELDARGAAVYARSINYEHQSMARRIFPYCARILGKKWEALVQDYYNHYPSSDFDFNKICKSFSKYLADSRPDLMKQFPYLAELADYEWLELEKLENKSKIIKAEKIDLNGLAQMQTYYPCVNPTLSVVHYKYPVADIVDKLKSSKKALRRFAEKPCTMAIYRDPDSDEARFIELAEASAAIVEQAMRQATVYQDLLKLTISLLPDTNPTSLALEFFELIEGLHTDNVFTGSKKREDTNGA